MKRHAPLVVRVCVVLGLPLTSLVHCRSAAISSEPSAATAGDSTRHAPEELSLDLGHGVTMQCVRIPAGRFLMGSPDGEKERLKNEGPQHEVTLSDPFFMGIHKVTQGQYAQVMGENPSTWKGDPRLPVEAVSMADAVEFCRRVSRLSGRTARLPTEAEWEYACRAGTTTRFSFGDNAAEFGDYAWYKANSDDGTFPIHPVGMKKPNAWGLFDMYGNLLERCSDFYADAYTTSTNENPRGPDSGSFHVLRGGNYHVPPGRCRSASRLTEGVVKKNHTIGFRVVVERER